jgi:hypothetical protein
MAGTIELSPDSRWSAASWLFEWVLNTLTRNIGDRDLAAALTEIVDENLGWFSVERLPDRTKAEVESFIRDRLIAKALQELPTDLLSNPKILEHLNELVAGLPD